MNERIKLLVEDANLRHFINEDGSLTPELHKFAELIVRECLDVSARTNRYYTEQFMSAKDDSGRDRAYGAGYACLLVSTEIKQHFGVEE